MLASAAAKNGSQLLVSIWGLFRRFGAGLDAGMGTLRS